jgi:hypothetical protein
MGFRFGFGFEAGDEAAEFLEFGEVVERLEEHLAEMGFQAGDFEQHFGAADHDAADEDRRHVVEVGAFREAVDLEDVGVAEDAAALFAEEAGFHAAEAVETPLVGGDVVDEVAFDGAARLEVIDVFGSVKLSRSWSGSSGNGNGPIWGGGDRTSSRGRAEERKVNSWKWQCFVGDKIF